PALAGVSAFGFGGTNAHPVLEEAPAAGAAPSPDSAPGHELALIPLSARSPGALGGLGGGYPAPFTEAACAVPLEDVARAAGRSRSHHDHRLAVVAATPEAAAEALRREADATVRRITGQRPRLVFVCSGQGSAWSGAGRELLHREPAFRTAL